MFPIIVKRKMAMKNKGAFIMRKYNYKALTVAVGLALLSNMGYSVSYAAADNNTTASIEAQIAEQERILAELNDKKNQKRNDELKEQIGDLEQQIANLRNKDKFDSQGAITALSAQLAKLQEEFEAQSKIQEKMIAALEKLDKLTKTNNIGNDGYERTYKAHTANSQALVNPGPQGNVSYTQDAKNSQGNSTMVFAYSPNQLYKIYCRTGYITDIALKKGEKINFVGGGDTSAWAIQSSNVDGVPHIYIKPVVSTSTTNIIITTDKRSYQLIVNTSDWYNPMVRWSYGQEEHLAAMQQKQRDERVITETMGVSNISSLNFDYKVKIKGDGNKPAMVFDDGNKTIIKFNKANKKLPALFIREKGHKAVMMANFKIKDNCYIIDRLIDVAELRYSDSDIVTIERKH